MGRRAVVTYGRSRRGYGLMVILAIGVILAMFMGAIGSSAVMNMRSLNSSVILDQAHYAAYSGVQAGLFELSQDPATSDVDSTGAPNVLILNFQDPRVTAQVIVFNNSAVAVHQVSNAPDGTVIPTGKVYIQSIGRIDDQNRTASSSLAAMAAPSQPKFDQALFADSSLSIPDGAVDCYSSSGLPYAPYDMTNPGLAQKKAPVGSNSLTAGAIQLGSTAMVDGKALAGMGIPNPLTVISLASGAFVSDGTSSMTTKKPLPTFQLPGSPTQSYASGLILDSTSQQLQAGGTYVVHGTLQLKNAASLTVAPGGNAMVYVTDSVDISGNSRLNPGGVPQALQLYVVGLTSGTGGGSAAGSFSMVSSQGSFVMAGADTTATVDSHSEVFGALMAKSLSLQGQSKLHYDVDLSTKYLGQGDWRVDSTISTGATVTASPDPGGSGSPDPGGTPTPGGSPPPSGSPGGGGHHGGGGGGGEHHMNMN